MNAYFQKLHPNAQIPTRGSEEAAGFDLKAVEPGVIQPGETQIVGTGLRLLMDVKSMSGRSAAENKVFVAKVMSRSGLAAKFGVFVLNAPGIIDQDYRGEIKVILHNASQKPYTYYSGDRVAQLLFEEAHVPEIVEATQIGLDTERGEGGLGSTGLRGENARIIMADEAAKETL